MMTIANRVSVGWLLLHLLSYISCCPRRQSYWVYRALPRGNSDRIISSIPEEKNNEGSNGKKQLSLDVLTIITQANVLLYVVYLRTILKLIGTLAMLLPTICSNQDLVKTLLERNPENFRYITKQLGKITPPLDLSVDTIDLGYLCGRKTGPLTATNILDPFDEGYKYKNLCY